MSSIYAQSASLISLDDAQYTYDLIVSLTKYFNECAALADKGVTVYPIFEHDIEAVEQAVEDYIVNLKYPQYDLQGSASLLERSFEEGPDQSLYVHDTENFDFDMVGGLLFILIQAEPNDVKWDLTYSVSCSKDLPDEFTGGILIVTKDYVDVMETRELYYKYQELASRDDRD